MLSISIFKPYLKICCADAIVKLQITAVSILSGSEHGHGGPSVFLWQLIYWPRGSGHWIATKVSFVWIAPSLDAGAQKVYLGVRRAFCWRPPIALYDSNLSIRAPFYNCLEKQRILVATKVFRFMLCCIAHQQGRLLWHKDGACDASKWSFQIHPWDSLLVVILYSALCTQT